MSNFTDNIYQKIVFDVDKYLQDLWWNVYSDWWNKRS